MGVIGLDLCRSGIGGMPRKLGRPRKKSKHTLNAKENNALMAEANKIVSGVFARPMVAMVPAPALVTP